MRRPLLLLVLAGSAAVAAVAVAQLAQTGPSPETGGSKEQPGPKAEPGAKAQPGPRAQSGSQPESESSRQPRDAAPGAGAASAFWRPVAEGFLLGQLPLGRTELFRIDLSRYPTAVVVPGKEAPRTAAQMRGARGALLAVNGGFFDENGKPLGLRIEDGQTRIKLRPRVDWGVVLLRAGSAAIVHSREYVEEPKIIGAIQVGPRLLVDGRPTRLKPQSARRTVVGVDRSGRWLTVGTSRDRVSAQDLAAALAGLDIHAAMMLDGGPSAQLSAKIGTAVVEIPGGYPVPDGLMILPARP